MIRSRDIADYFEAKLQDLKPEVALDFDVHLYFTRNRHLMIWRATGETLSAEFIQKYIDRGITTVWIHREDADAFHRYFNPAPPAADDIVRENPKTDAAELITAVLESPVIQPEQKEIIVSTAAKQLVTELAQPRSVPAQAPVTAEARKTVKEVLHAVASEAESIVEEIWKLCEVEPELEHAVNVSTYAVIFAMAFGKIDPEIIADIALAGLLHDVGKSQLPVETARLNWKDMDLDSLILYSQHVNASVRIIDQHAKEARARVKQLVVQHHEKFNGSGYPNRMKGFELNDLGQLISMADLLDAVCSGQWDGTARSIGEAFEVLEKFESNRNFPEYFNPELFSTVNRWIKSTPAPEDLKEAAKLVGKKTQELVKRAS